MRGGNGNSSRFDAYGQGTFPGMSVEEETAARHLDPYFRVRTVGRIMTFGSESVSVRETSEQIMDRIWAGTKERMERMVQPPEVIDIPPAVD